MIMDVYIVFNVFKLFVNQHYAKWIILLRLHILVEEPVELISPDSLQTQFSSRLVTMLMNNVDDERCVDFLFHDCHFANY